MRLLSTTRKLIQQVLTFPFRFAKSLRGGSRSRSRRSSWAKRTRRTESNSDLDPEARSLLGESGQEKGESSKMSLCCCAGDKQFQNVLLLSGSFMLVFTAFQTMGNIEKIVLTSIQDDTPGFEGDGYTSLAIIYGVFSISNWLAPSIVAIFSAKWSMIFGAVLYTAFIASFLYPLTWLLYGMSAILGFGAAIIWTAQGSYLTLCSNEMTMSRNSGMFWAILQSSMFFGNSFVFWQFEGKSVIDRDTRNLVFGVLTGVAVIGVCAMSCLRTPSPDLELDDSEAVAVAVQSEGALTALKSSLKLFTQRDMILLAFTFFYTGIELSFFSSVYSSSVAFTNRFPEARRLVGLCGILVGGGEVFGGAIFGLLGSRTVKHGRDPIVLLGFICHTVAYFLIFLNLPDSAPLGPTDDLPYLKNPSVLIAMLCAFLLGFGDSCYNTQIYSILGGLYPDQSAPAFALFKFTQSAAAAIAFFNSSVITLRIQLGILQSFCVLGTLTFFLVEWASVKRALRAGVAGDSSCAENSTSYENEDDKD